jgi:predicted DsbA family dithiol-disulfide isomerase
MHAVAGAAHGAEIVAVDRRPSARVLRQVPARGRPHARGRRVATLRVYTDYIAPACYLVEPVLARLRADGVDIEYRAFELLPAPHPVPDFDRADERAAWAAEVEPLALSLDVPIRRPTVGVRTRKAHEAACFARERGRFDALHGALFRAYFADGVDIGRIDRICALGAEAGLDAAELRVALGLDTYGARVAAEREEALDAGLAGAPGFVLDASVGARTRTGWQDYASLRAWIDQAARRDS